MKPLTRTRLLLVTLFLFPVVVIVLFWIFGKEPPNPEATLPLIPPH